MAIDQDAGIIMDLEAFRVIHEKADPVQSKKKGEHICAAFLCADYFLGIFYYIQVSLASSGKITDSSYAILCFDMSVFCQLCLIDQGDYLSVTIGKWQVGGI